MGYEEFDNNKKAAATQPKINALILTTIKITFGIALGFSLAFVCLMLSVHRVADKDADERILSRQHRHVSDEQQTASWQLSGGEIDSKVVAVITDEPPPTIMTKPTTTVPPTTTSTTTTTTTTSVPLLEQQPLHGYGDNNNGSGTIAEQLKSSVRITCFVMMSTTEDLEMRTRRVLNSWATHCNNIVFMTAADDGDGSSEEHEHCPEVVSLPGKVDSWQQLNGAIAYLYKHHQNETDYYVRADDRSFVLLDNLRHMLYPNRPDMPLYFGAQHKKSILSVDYDVPAGVFVLSNKAVAALAEMTAQPTGNLFEKKTAHQELMARLRFVDASRGNAMDELQKERFLDVQPRTAITPVLLWYRLNTMLNFCSKKPVSLHPLSMYELLSLQYLAYRQQPFGFLDVHNELPAKLGPLECMQLPRMRSSRDD